MRWRRTDSPDVIDVRGRRGLSIPMGGFGRIGGGFGLVGVLVYLAIQVLSGGGGFDVGGGFGGQAPVSDPRPGSGIPPAQDPDRDLRDFSAYVFDQAQRSWEETFEREGRRYERAQLVLFSGAVSTGCGHASAAVGPFYCGADQRVYLDLSFFRDMESQLGAGGDFAWAYVIAHEVGHHVQQRLGTSAEVREKSRETPDDANALSVRQELQADCYSGVWASTVYARGDLEEGDLSEAFTASEAVGDDRLQQRGRGEVNPDTFTHGTSAQRREWFERGYRSAEAGACDTFGADEV